MRFTNSFFPILILFCWGICFNLGHAQQNQFILHVDKPFYATGETIWYNLYLPQALHKKTVMIKGVLVDQAGNVTDRFFKKADKQSSINGFLTIPYNYNSGSYNFIFKACPDKSNQEITLANIEFPIYNDLRGINLELSQTPPSPTDKMIANTLEIDISMAKESVQPREKVSASIEIKDSQGNPVDASYSVVVTDATMVQSAMPGEATYSIGPELTTTQMDRFLEEIFILGKLTDTLDQPFQANVLGAYASEQNKFHYAKSNKDGIFTLQLDDFYQEQSLQFVGFPKEIEDIRVSLLPEASPSEKPKSKFFITEQIVAYLELSRQRKKMAQYFEDLETNVALQEFANEVQELKPDFTYVIAEYEKFEDIGSFLNELLAPLQLKTVKGKTIATMSNPRAKITVLAKLEGTPLFIIDGKVTRNAEFFSKINLGNVETIDLFYVPENLRKQFNVMGANGVARITTIVPQFDLPAEDKEDLYTVSGLQPKGSLILTPEKQNYQEDAIPNFKTPIYWSPASEKTQNKGNIEFIQSDDKSTFVISVFAKTPDGKMGFATKEYVVK